MRIPIALVCFNRPHYFRRVIASLKAQEGVEIADDDITLFLDGAVNTVSGIKYSEESLLDESEAIFRDAFPGGRVARAESNLGVALNYERAENYVFEDLNAPVALFFEDDLLLGPHYLEAMKQLIDFALNEPLVAYVGAYGDHRADLATQQKRATEIIPMHHKWGFALTRRQWERQREVVSGYLDIVRERPYIARDHARIRSYFASLDYSSPGTSQDAAKDVASLVLGTTKIMCFPCLAKNIGREGTHTRPATFDAQGYDKAALFPGPVPRLDMPTREKLSTWIATEQRNARVQPPPPTSVNQPAIPPRMVDPEQENELPQPNESLCPIDRFVKLTSEIFGGDPYEGFIPLHDKPIFEQNWNGTHPLLTRLVQQANPQIIVDLGVWQGLSTATLARAQQASVAHGITIAIDSFLGSPEHWTRARTDVHSSLKFQHGRPDFYLTFLSNMINSGLSNRVIPIAQTSENAARILARMGIRPDLIHIDAAHEYEPALRDIQLYYDLLAPGGILMGDDFVWSSVARAVVHFTDKMRLPFSVEHPKWVVRKPK